MNRVSRHLVVKGETMYSRPPWVFTKYVWKDKFMCLMFSPCCSETSVCGSLKTPPCTIFLQRSESLTLRSLIKQFEEVQNNSTRLPYPLFLEKAHHFATNQLKFTEYWRLSCCKAEINKNLNWMNFDQTEWERDGQLFQRLTCVLMVWTDRGLCLTASPAVCKDKIMKNYWFCNYWNILMVALTYFE